MMMSLLKLLMVKGLEVSQKREVEVDLALDLLPGQRVDQDPSQDPGQDLTQGLNRVPGPSPDQFRGLDQDQGQGQNRVPEADLVPSRIVI